MLFLYLKSKIHELFFDSLNFILFMNTNAKITENVRFGLDP